MPVRMRLQRHGKKNKPFFHIVVADGRAPRDGKFIEKIGTYDPSFNPAQIDLSIDKAYDWLQKGAQPSDTVKRILSYKGVLLKKHLQVGVQKGAMTQEQADAKFNQWLESKTTKIDSKVKGIADASVSEKKARLEAETKIKDTKKAAIEAKKVVEVQEEKVEVPKEVVEAKKVVEVQEEKVEVPKEVVEAKKVVEVQEEKVEVPKEVVEVQEEKVEVPKEVVEVQEEKVEVPKEVVEVPKEKVEKVIEETPVEAPASEEAPPEEAK